MMPHTSNGLAYSAKLSHRLQSSRLESFPWKNKQSPTCSGQAKASDRMKGSKEYMNHDQKSLSDWTSEILKSTAQKTLAGEGMQNALDDIVKKLIHANPNDKVIITVAQAEAELFFMIFEDSRLSPYLAIESL